MRLHPIPEDRAIHENFGQIEKLLDTKRIFNLSGASPPWNLGNFDKDAQGIRVTMMGSMSWTTAAWFLVARPNGLSTISSAWQIHESYWDLSTQQHSVIDGSNIASRSGMVLTRAQWSGSGSEYFAMEATIFCQHVGGVHFHHGYAVHRDNVTNGNRFLGCNVYGHWQDVSAPITSLDLTVTGGASHTFTGRITTETF